jgi:hypothetical protein
MTKMKVKPDDFACRCGDKEKARCDDDVEDGIAFTLKAYYDKFGHERKRKED